MTASPADVREASPVAVDNSLKSMGSKS
jgi:hypothetical protein